MVWRSGAVVLLAGYVRGLLVGGESRGEGIFPPCGEREGGGFPLHTCLEARVLVGEEYHVWLFTSTVQGRHDN